MDKIFKVVHIMDEYTIIINAGQRDGVTIGTRFQIFDDGYSVLDPDTGENYGSIDYVKETVITDDVREKMCLCHSTTSIFSDALQNSIATLSNAKKLNLDISQQISLDVEKTIRIGDKVRMIKNLPNEIIQEN